MPFNLSPSRGFDTSARARFTNKACRINRRTPASLSNGKASHGSLPLRGRLNSVLCFFMKSLETFPIYGGSSNPGKFAMHAKAPRLSCVYQADGDVFSDFLKFSASSGSVNTADSVVLSVTFALSINPILPAWKPEVSLQAKYGSSFPVMEL